MLRKILKLKLKFIGGIVIALVLLQLITAYVFGYMAQTELETQFKRMTDSQLIKVVKHEYNRGLFSSDENTELAINSAAISNILRLLPQNQNNAESSLSGFLNQSYSIKYTTHVTHGLLAALINGDPVPSIAYAKTTIEYPDNFKKILDTFFGKKTPISIENTIFLNKSGRYRISSPSFNYDEAVSGVKVVWGGLNWTIGYNEKVDQFKNKFSMPLFSLSAPTKGKVEINAIEYNSNTKYSVNKIKVGTTNLSLGSLEVAWKDKITFGFKAGDVIHMLTGISATEFLNNIDSLDPFDFKLGNVNYSSNSSDVDNFFKASALVKFDSLSSNSKVYGPMNLDLSVGHIYSPAFSILADKIESLSTKSESVIDENMLNTVTKYFGPILVRNPIINLNKFELNSPDGAIKISGSATTNNFTLDDLDEQQKFMQKLVLDINISVPKPVLSYLFIMQMKYLLSAGNAQIDPQSAEALTKVVNILLDSQINTWLKKGYLKNNNNSLETHMIIKDGQLSLNGVQSN